MLEFDPNPSVKKAVAVVPPGDPVKYAWRGLEGFRNLDYVTDQLVTRHHITRKEIQNAKKQAAQIRYCLIQAKEYFDAFSAVSNATRPLLLYYATMSLALAEVLWKQTGDSSLDSTRAEHNHHGLMLVPRGRKSDDFETAAASLVAKPYINRHGTRAGTFELWHRTARASPVFGRSRTHYIGIGQSSGAGEILAVADLQMPLIGESGISLRECITFIPAMARHLHRLGGGTELARATVELDQYEESPRRIKIQINVHPGLKTANERLFQSIRVEPNAIDQVQITEFPNGFSLTAQFTIGRDFVRFIAPNGFSVTQDETCFGVDEMPLNELGYYYVSLFICGMYARYYPDLWMKDLERSCPLATAVSVLMDAASERIPLLALGELTDTHFLLD